MVFGNAGRRYLVSGLLVLAAIVFVTVQVLTSQSDTKPVPQSAPASTTPTSSPTPIPSVPAPTRSVQPQVSEQPDAQPCLPVRLVIPRIGVDTLVLALGSTAEGVPAVPDNPTQVSWWKPGVIPGNPGVAGLQGHTWSTGDGVFDQLPELRQGDVIKLYGADCQLTFQVDQVQRHVSPDLSGPQLAKYYRVSGEPGITLVTCGDYNAGEYDSRIVVSASLATEQQN